MNPAHDGSGCSNDCGVCNTRIDNLRDLASRIHSRLLSPLSDADRLSMVDELERALGLSAPEPFEPFTDRMGIGKSNWPEGGS